MPIKARDRGQIPHNLQGTITTPEVQDPIRLHLLQYQPLRQGITPQPEAVIPALTLHPVPVVVIMVAEEVAQVAVAAEEDNLKTKHFKNC